MLGSAAEIAILLVTELRRPLDIADLLLLKALGVPVLEALGPQRMQQSL